ncbi:hypothetical protein [Corynebacterium deserti]|uniref:hypothetical protein n=1 Tax=Corynebacterium deserti TaxID=1408191 RepID=UPI001E3985BF|nr:hypothetical protein [Corynebacterium deserti]
MPEPTARKALPVLSSEVSAARRAVIADVKTAVSGPLLLDVLVVFVPRRLVVEVFGPVDFPDDRELPRLGAPFLTVMTTTLVA